MTIHPIIFDHRPAYLAQADSSASLLTMPLGAYSVIAQLRASLARLECRPLHVIPSFDPGDGYEAALREGNARAPGILRDCRLDELLQSVEPSDWLLLINSLRIVPGGFDFEGFCRTDQHAGWMRHAIAMDVSPDGSREFVEIDDGGRVRRIQRFYEGFTWVNASAIVASLISGASARLVRGGRFRSIADVRRELVSRGVPSEDQPIGKTAFDLSNTMGLLRANEFCARAAVDKTPVGYYSLAEGVMIGAGCSIAPAVRLYGPVVIQPGAVIESGATIVGPVVIGAAARIGSGALLAQSTLAAGAAISSGEAVLRRLVCESPREHAASRLPDSSELQVLGAPLVRAAPQQRRDRRPARVYPIVKRVLDTVIAAAGLIVLSPLILVVALLIKLTSRGPILFGHAREGRHGREFRCWKFRTMVADAHLMQRDLYQQSDVDGPQFKIEGDPRITAIGRWLRATNLDELPQLINVFLGEMSLIGPRPSPFRENQICVPWRLARLSVNPGITGLWQICRHDRVYGDFHQWINYDMLYVRHLSLLLDVKIFIATLLTLGGRWAVPISKLIPPRAGAAPPDTAVERSALKTNRLPLGPGGAAEPSRVYEGIAS